MTITYEYEGALYVNLTNKCNCACEFCLRQGKAKGSIYTEDSLWLEREPTREEILADIESRDLSQYKQLVFCGFGEPAYRLEDIFWVIDQMKAHGTKMFTRINTNGTACAIHGRDGVPGVRGPV